MPESPDTEAIAARLETARKYPYNAYAKFYAEDIPALLAALASEKERAEKAFDKGFRKGQRTVETETAKRNRALAAAEQVIEAAKEFEHGTTKPGFYIGGNDMMGVLLSKLRATLANYHTATTEPKDDRLPECVAAWPECFSGGYDPRCCRFPKSCSCSP